MEVREQVENVEQAIPLIRNTSPDLAIAHISLKGLSGLELIKGLKAISIGVPVLVLSPHDDSLYAERALRAGATGYITKHQLICRSARACRRGVSSGKDEIVFSEAHSYHRSQECRTRDRSFGRSRIGSAGVKRAWPYDT